MKQKTMSPDHDFTINNNMVSAVEPDPSVGVRASFSPYLLALQRRTIGATDPMVPCRQTAKDWNDMC